MTMPSLVTTRFPSHKEPWPPVSRSTTPNRRMCSLSGSRSSPPWACWLCLVSSCRFDLCTVLVWMFVASVRCKERPRSWPRCHAQRESAWAQWERWPAATSLKPLTAQTAGRLRCWSTTVMTTAPPTALMRSPFHWEDWLRKQARWHHSLSGRSTHSGFSPHLHPSPGLVYVTYNLDNSVSNPYQLWKGWAGPDYPTVQQFRLLRSVQVGSPLSWTHWVWLSSTFRQISPFFTCSRCSNVFMPSPSQALM